MIERKKYLDALIKKKWNDRINLIDFLLDDESLDR